MKSACGTINEAQISFMEIRSEMPNWYSFQIVNVAGNFSLHASQYGNFEGSNNGNGYILPLWVGVDALSLEMVLPQLYWGFKQCCVGGRWKANIHPLG